jgi:hypothetical protein
LPINLTTVNAGFLPFQRNSLKVNLEFEKPADQKANDPAQSKEVAPVLEDDPQAIAAKNIDLGYYYVIDNILKGDHDFGAISNGLMSNDKARLIVKVYYTDSTNEKMANTNLGPFVKELQARGVKDASNRIELQQIQLPRNQLPQEGGKLPATKVVSEVIHVTGVNFSANYNNRGAKKY